MEVPTVVSFSSLQRTAEQSIDIPGAVNKVCTQDTVPQRQWASRSLTLLFRVVVEGWVVEVLKGFLQDRVQQRFVQIKLGASVAVARCTCLRAPPPRPWPSSGAVRCGATSRPGPSRRSSAHVLAMSGAVARAASARRCRMQPTAAR